MTDSIGRDGRHEWSDPQWDKARRVHDWRNYINDELRAIWHTFTDNQKQAIRNNADDLAATEEWE